MPPPNHIDIPHLRRLRSAALVEGTTLILLLGIAVPLKHLAGLPSVVSVVGPIHGMAFLSYLWMVFNSVSSQSWSRREIGCLLAAAFLPLGGLLTMSLIHRKLQLAAPEPGHQGDGMP